MCVGLMQISTSDTWRIALKGVGVSQVALAGRIASKSLKMGLTLEPYPRETKQEY
jgi:hypothetical protein